MNEICKALDALARKQGGQHPSKLVELESDYFPNGVPKDPFTKEAYHYERTATGFRLTCLGKDEAPGGAEIPERDIVFDEKGQREP